MSQYAMYLNYTPTGKWVLVGSVPISMKDAVFSTLYQAKNYAMRHGYYVEPNGRLIKA